MTSVYILFIRRSLEIFTNRSGLLMYVMSENEATSTWVSIGLYSGFHDVPVTAFFCAAYLARLTPTPSLCESSHGTLPAFRQKSASSILLDLRLIELCAEKPF